MPDALTLLIVKALESGGPIAVQVSAADGAKLLIGIEVLEIIMPDGTIEDLDTLYGISDEPLDPSMLN